MKAGLLFFFLSTALGAFWVQEFNGSDGFAAARIQGTGCLHAASDSYYIIGGMPSISVGATTGMVKDVLIYNMNNHSFSYGAPYPLTNSAFGCAFVGDTAWGWGGSTSAGRTDVTASLQVGATSWQNVSTGIPPNRSFHTLSAIGTKLYLQGGSRGAAAFLFNDTYTFDTTNPSSVGWTQTNASNVPSARTGTTSSVWNNTLYIFGGRAGGTFNNQVWAYYPTSNNWTLLQTTGTPPSAKVAVGAISHDGKFFIYSGGNRGVETEYLEFHYLDLTNLTWITINIPSTAYDGVSYPGKRSYYNSWIHKNKLYVALGAYANGVPNPPTNGGNYNDVWSLDLAQWSPLPVATSATTSATSEATSEATSATTSATSETTSATSQTTSATSATTSATSQTTSATSQTTSATSQTTSATSQTTSATSQTTSATSQTTSATSASSSSSMSTSSSAINGTRSTSTMTTRSSSSEIEIDSHSVRLAIFVSIVIAFLF